MIKHRDWTIILEEYCYGYEAVHDDYEGIYESETWLGSHPVFHGNTVQDCIEQIDDWYEENE